MVQPQKRISCKRQGGGFGGAQIALMYPDQRRFLVELATPGGLLRQPSIIQSARNCFYTNSPPSSTYTSNRANLAAKLEQRLRAVLILGDWINLCKLRLQCNCICIRNGKRLLEGRSPQLFILRIDPSQVTDSRSIRVKTSI